MRTRIKFCGMTRPGDVRLAGELGVDAIGVVFAARSRRRVGIEQAAVLRAAAAPLVSVVALFMDNDGGEIERAIRALRPHLLQFHGSEDDAFCRSFGLPFLKAIAMGAAPGHVRLAPGVADADAAFARYPSAAGFLLDGHAVGEPGGGGRAFDWVHAPRSGDRPWLLAGGLHPDNVGVAIAQVRPWGVDVSSGIEADGTGSGADACVVKDGDKMRRFVAAVAGADAERANNIDHASGGNACGKQQRDRCDQH